MKILNGLSGQAILHAKRVKVVAKTRKICAPAHGSRMSDEHGNMLVEAAVIFPVFVLAMVGIFSLAFVCYNQLTLTQAVGSAAQYLQNNRLNSALTDPCANALTVIENSAPSLIGSDITLSLNIGGTKVTARTCATDLSTFQAAQGAPVTVSATYPCDFNLLSGAAALVKQTFTSTCQMSAQVTEYEY